MFDSIAPAYDFMNTAMSLGMHRRWRDKALQMAASTPMMQTLQTAGRAPRIIDIATGTGDLAFALADRFTASNVTGVDLSEGMLDIARRKRERLAPSQASLITFETGDCLDLTFPDDTFHLCTVAYGVRNFADLLRGLREINRVLVPGGTVCVIELSRPVNPLLRGAYDLYSRFLIPLAGRLASGDGKAYAYLPRSIRACPQRERMTALMREAGFRHCSFKALTMGVVCIYIGIK